LTHPVFPGDYRETIYCFGDTLLLAPAILPRVAECISYNKMTLEVGDSGNHLLIEVKNKEEDMRCNYRQMLTYVD